MCHDKRNMIMIASGALSFHFLFLIKKTAETQPTNIKKTSINNAHRFSLVIIGKLLRQKYRKPFEPFQGSYESMLALT